MGNLFKLLKPNTASLAYALFLATNAASIWGGVFPFLPLEYQTQNLLLWFFLAQATAFACTFLVNAVTAYRRPLPTHINPVPYASTPYFVGWALLIASVYLHDLALPCVTAGGAFLGLGSAGFYLLWQRLFIAQGFERGTRDLVLGTAYAALMYFALYLIPRAITVYLIPLVFMPLFSLALVLGWRTVEHDHPMFTDVPHEHPQVYRQAVRTLWRSTLCIASVGICTGIMRAVAIEDPIIGAYVNVFSMVALMAVAVAVLVLWRVKSLKLDVTGMYRIVFPLVVTALALFPFMPVVYKQVLAGGLYAVYSVALVLLMIQAGQASRDRGVNPRFLYGVLGGTVFALHDLGFIVGSVVMLNTRGPALSMAAVALVTLYLLVMAHFMATNNLHDTLTSAFDDSSIELVALAAPPGPQAAAQAREGHGSRKHAHAPAPAATHAYQDRISKQVGLVRERYALSAREAEVAELVVRGKTVPRIAEELYVSENTVRTHTKRIYAKLDIHKKGELIDLVETI